MKLTLDLNRCTFLPRTLESPPTLNFIEKRSDVTLLSPLIFPRDPNFLLSRSQIIQKQLQIFQDMFYTFDYHERRRRTCYFHSILFPLISL
ncbi:unnamed protein product [Brassica oleracea]